MKTTHKVVGWGCLPTRFPLGTTLLYYLLMDHFKVPGWAWGAWGAIMVIIWVLYFVAVWHEERVDIFEKESQDERQNVPLSRVR